MGFIRLDRKFFKNEYWTKKRSYSQAEAWLDLIQMARFEAEPTKKTLPNGRRIIIERGEVHASLRFLSARWSWGLTQVRTFLRNAVDSHQITQRVTQGENVITLCKYDDYNPLFLQENTPSNTPTTHRRHTDNTKLRKNKNVENVENVKNVKKDDNVNSDENVDTHKKEKRIREKKFFSPPALIDVESYFTENGYTTQAAKKFFDFYQVGDWKDSNGKQVQNWKQKSIAVWFKPENSIQKPPQNNVRL
ncbi:MAG: hypothetical protein LBC84_06815 [Prevotellaceae bacterium]|jgi:hypothetical protein|nr:hypothetical protein [Prevotellaceae bacterium]